MTESGPLSRSGTSSDATEIRRACECCEAEGGAEFVVDRRGDAYCPDCHASLMGELQRMIDKLPKRIALCPQCAPEFYYPLRDDEGLMCPTPDCGLTMIVYAKVAPEPPVGASDQTTGSVG